MNFKRKQKSHNLISYIFIMMDEEHFKIFAINFK